MRRPLIVFVTGGVEVVFRVMLLAEGEGAS